VAELSKQERVLQAIAREATAQGITLARAQQCAADASDRSVIAKWLADKYSERAAEAQVTADSWLTILEALQPIRAHD
jgi:hypothetical protein